ncbi:hypothetical protein IE077_002050 [Cardiosporidium cionae]|uniref:Uncharacterized protein n=1 Tax=Cardiosporidium cionae TaxID=476202 RepID=A0ABQ7JGT2_9APIC|nr:hypothetical protein IE077_002050 [Cardiosporidium cionae]|eukprot:KAF8822910.1 hypothetical protein IE077_002050 [Cardiosporidium cionae]
MQRKHHQLLRSSEAQYVGRSRADRLLDRAYNSQKKQLRATLDSTCKNNSLGKRKFSQPNKTEPVVKKIKPEDKTGVSLKPAPSTTSKSAIEALQEIVSKHLRSRNKFPKAVQLVRMLLDGLHMNRENKPYFLHALECIARSDSCTSSEDARSHVIDLFENGLKPYERSAHASIDRTKYPISSEFSNELNQECSILLKSNEGELYNSDDTKAVIEKSPCSSSASSNPQITEETVLDDHEKYFLDILRLRAVLHNKVRTDDTFQFTNIVNKLKAIFLDICSATVQEESNSIDDGGEANRNVQSDYIASKDSCTTSVARKTTTQGNDCLTFSEIESSKMLDRQRLKNLKMFFFFEILPTIFAHQSHVISDLTLGIILIKLFKDIFSFHQCQQISEWQSALKMKHKVSQSVKALAIGETLNPVRDSREERISTIHGSAVWSAKQTGSACRIEISRLTELNRMIHA